jgi:hypothetical protein
VETLLYELQYYRPRDVDDEAIVIRGTLSLMFVDDESLVAEIHPRVKTIHAIQMAAEMDAEFAQ